MLTKDKRDDTEGGEQHNTAVPVAGYSRSCPDRTWKKVREVAGKDCFVYTASLCLAADFVQTKS